MNLRERLRMLGAAGSQRPPAPLAQPPDSPISQPSSLTAGLQSVETPLGPAHMVDTVYPADLARGDVRLAELAAVPPMTWAGIGRHPAWQGLPVDGWAFLDTETTGLAGGTGTVVFLVGIGRLQGGVFRLRQFFLRDLPEEGAFLSAIAAELATAQAVVTFNGKSFDWPLLQTRHILHRLRLAALPHLDLIHPARRMWRHLAGDCSLRGLEGAVLTVERQDDIPGYQIPQVYFHYLRTGDAAGLDPVFRHNRLDILSLAALGAYLGHALAEPALATPAGRRLSAGEMLAAGRWLVQQGALRRGGRALAAALASGQLGDAQRAICRRFLALAHRRGEELDLACRVWQEWAEATELHVPEPLVQLAKHYEHRVRDLAKARDFTRQALQSVELVPGVAPVGRLPAECSLPALLHRLARLEARLRRATGPRSRGGILSLDPA